MCTLAPRRFNDGTPTHLIPGSDVSAGSQQRSHAGLIPVPYRDHQGGVPALVVAVVPTAGVVPATQVGRGM